jgi:hypothetical protein
MRTASTIKVTNRDKEKQREVRMILERKDELLTSQITSVKRKAEIEASEEKEHKRIKLSVTSQSCECVRVTDEWKIDLRALNEARASLSNFVAFLMLSLMWYFFWILCQRHFQILIRCFVLRVMNEKQLSMRMNDYWARRWNIEKLINSHSDWFQAYMIVDVQNDDDEDINDDDNQIDSKVIVVEDDVDKKLNASKNDEEEVEKEKSSKKELNQKNEFDVLLEFWEDEQNFFVIEHSQ